MSFFLRNEFISLLIQEPGSPYKGARFDWTGQIIQITFLNKHTFCTTESLKKNMINKQGRGLYNEFGIDQPIGYENSQMGGHFLKVGIGLLTKHDNGSYNFFSNYEIRPSKFQYSIDKSNVQFICEEKINNTGYAYTLEKRIELNGNTFSIHYALSNYGDKIINTNEYVHNFLSINNRQIDKNYRLVFPFKINKEKLESFVNPNNSINIENDTITWKDVSNDQFFISNLNTDFYNNCSWTLVNLDDKVGIRERVDFNVHKINLWGSSHVISPEIYINLKIEPGKKLLWSRMYELFSFE